MLKAIKIGILGAGTIGQAVIEILTNNREIIFHRVGAEIQIKRIFVRKSKIEALRAKKFPVTADYYEILNDPEIKIVVELIGGIEPAKSFILEAMAHGKNVVTANKDVVAQFGRELFESADKYNVRFLFEASVGGAIPIIMALERSLTANKITEILGIVNGTTNYMLSKMTELNLSHEAVLKEAQRKGYAESNPESDVEGKDAARKIAILTSIAFNSPITLENVSVEGITQITPEDITYASKLGYVVKLLAIGKNTEKGLDIRVNPVLLKKEHPLAAVNGVSNAIFIKGYPIGEAMFFGIGAGKATASSVVADIIEIARNLDNNRAMKLINTFYKRIPVCSADEIVSSYYIRLLVEDKPNVLGKIAMIFGNFEVSLKSVMQTRTTADTKAEVVVITHEVKHKNILKAREVLKGLSVVNKIFNIIRVERS